MAWISEERERERLSGIYAEMGDEELSGLHATAGDLTESAQVALAGEMRRRGLSSAAPEQGSNSGSFDKDASSGWKTLHIFHQTFEAQAAFRLMKRDGIEFAVEDRTVNDKGEVVPGPAIQLALMVNATDWDRAVVLLRREAGLFPEPVVDPRGEEEDPGGEADWVAVGEFEEAADIAAAERALGEAGVAFRIVRHEGEDWERTSMEVGIADQDRALGALEGLLEEDA